MKKASDLSRYVLEEFKNGNIEKKTAIDLVKQFNEKEDIAVIGMNCKFSDVEDCENYWKILNNQQTVIERCDKERVDLIRFCFPSQMLKDESDYAKGSFIKDIDKFDYDFFSFTKEEGDSFNPGHRMILQVAYRTLEDAGYLGERLKDNKTGVFIGNNFTKDFIFSYSIAALQAVNYSFNFDYMINNWSSGLATRISNVFDLKGPSYVLDVSCPSSTVAIYNACRAIKDNICTTAIAGGLLVDMSPIKRYNDSGWIFMHDDKAITRGYDDNVGGAYIGEGAGAVFLKPLDKALEDGDRIHGVIRGSSFSNNGSNGSYAQSSVEDIKNMVINCFKESQVDPNKIGYLEGEGYPHKLEEGLELAGLIGGFNYFTNRKQYCGIGSLSANVGYLQSAIGVFNSIKCLMALKNKTIPPQYHFVSPNDVVNLCNSPFYVSDISKAWDVAKDEKRCAAVFSYGYGGNNLLLLYEEAPERVREEQNEQEELFILTAAARYSLLKGVDSFVEFLENGTETSLADICYTASVRRKLFLDHRLAIVTSSKEDLLNKLKEYQKNGRSTDEVFHSVYCETEKYKNRKSRQGVIEGKTLHIIGKEFCQGVSFAFSSLFENRKVYHCDIPVYVYHKQSCWCFDRDKMLVPKSKGFSR